MKNIYISTPVRWLIFIVIVIGTAYMVVFPGKGDHGYNYGAMIGSLAIGFLCAILILGIDYSKNRKKGMNHLLALKVAAKYTCNLWIEVFHLKAKRRKKSKSV